MNQSIRVLISIVTEYRFELNLAEYIFIEQQGFIVLKHFKTITANECALPYAIAYSLFADPAYFFFFFDIFSHVCKRADNNGYTKPCWMATKRRYM